MKLNKILEGLEVKETVNNLNLDITNIHSDSRKIKQGGLFIAIDGYLQNGIDYLELGKKNSNGKNFKNSFFNSTNFSNVTSQIISILHS